VKRTFSIALALATAFALVLPAGANERLEPATPAPTAAIPDAPVYEGFGAWFVELASPPGATGTSRARLASEKRDFRSAAAAAGIAYTERFAFDTLFNGLSVDIAPGHLFRLAQLPQVKAIHPVHEVQRPTTTTVGPDLATAIQMTGADVAQSELGLDGTGIKVAVMDTGVDYDHPDLGGCFGPGCRVAYGWDFVGDDFNADPDSPAYNPVPVPGPDPDDCQGHGTHVAGIVGANGEVVGVAPGVTFGAYRVFGCDGSTTTDIMIAAMEMALADGMDILNMSIGSAFSWPQGPTAVASNLLVDAGMVVVASIGNSGASGTFSAGSPGLGEKVIGVAAFENTLAVFPVFEVDGDPIGFNPLEFSAEPPTEGTEEIVFIGRACIGDPLEADPDGKVALAVRGECAFSEKANNAIDAGATAVIIHNNAPQTSAARWERLPPNRRSS
jgi:minor extracellular serine protease Vpr